MPMKTRALLCVASSAALLLEWYTLSVGALTARGYAEDTLNNTAHQAPPSENTDASFSAAEDERPADVQNVTSPAINPRSFAAYRINRAGDYGMHTTASKATEKNGRKEVPALEWRGQSRRKARGSGAPEGERVAVLESPRSPRTRPPRLPVKDVAARGAGAYADQEQDFTGTDEQAFLQSSTAGALPVHGIQRPLSTAAAGLHYSSIGVADAYDSPRPDSNVAPEQAFQQSFVWTGADAYNAPRSASKALREQSTTYDSARAVTMAKATQGSVFQIVRPRQLAADSARRGSGADDTPRPTSKATADQRITRVDATLGANTSDTPRLSSEAAPQQSLTHEYVIKAVYQQLHDSPTSAQADDTRDYSKPGIKEEGDDVPTSDSARLQADTYDIPTAAVKTIHEQPLIHDFPTSAQADDTRDLPKPETSEEADQVPTSDSARLQADAYNVPVAPVKAIHEEALSYDSPTSAQADDMRDFPKPEIKVEVDVVPTSDSARLQADAYDVPTAAAKAIHEQQLIPDSPISAQADDTRDFPKTETNEEADEVPTSDCAPLQADAYDVPTAAVKAVHEEPRIHDSPTSAQADDTRDFPKPEIKEEGDEVPTSDSARLQAHAYDVPTAAVKAIHEQPLIHDFPTSAQADDTRDLPKPETSEEADQVPTSDSARLQADAYNVPVAPVKAIHEEALSYDTPTSAQADGRRDYSKPEIEKEGVEVPTSDSARRQADAYDLPTAAVKAVHEQPLSYNSPTSAHADDTRDFPKPEIKEEGDEVPTSDSARRQADAYDVSTAAANAIHEQQLIPDSPISAQADDTRDYSKPGIKEEGDDVPTSDSARLQADTYDIPTAAVKTIHEQPLIHDFPTSAQADDTRDLPKPETSEEADQVPTSDSARLQADAYNVPVAPVKAIHEEALSDDTPTSAQADGRRDYSKPEIEKEVDEVLTNASARLQADAYDVPTAAAKAPHEQQLIPDSPMSAQADDTRDFPKAETNEEADEVPTSDCARLQADTYDVPTAAVKTIHEQQLIPDSPTSAQADDTRHLPKPETSVEADQVPTSDSARLQADAYNVPVAAVNAIHEQPLSYDTPTSAQADGRRDYSKPEIEKEVDEALTNDSARFQADAYDVPTAAAKAPHEQQLIPDSPISAHEHDTRYYSKPGIKEEGDDVPTSDFARLQVDTYDIPTAAVKTIHEQQLIPDSPMSAQADDTRDFPKAETNEEADEVPTSDCAPLQADAYDVPTAAVKAVHEEPRIHDSPTSAQADDTRDFPKPEIKEEGDEVPTSDSARLQAHAYDVPTAAVKAIHEQPLIHDFPTSAQADDTRDLPKPETSEEADQVPTSDSARLQADAYNVPVAAVNAIHEQPLSYDTPTSAQADGRRDYSKPEIEKEVDEALTNDSARFQADAYDVPTAAAKAPHEQQLIPDSPISAHEHDTRYYSKPGIKEEGDDVPTSDFARLQVDTYDIPTAAVKTIHEQQLIPDSPMSAQADDTRDFPKAETNEEADEVPTSDCAPLQADAYDVPTAAVKAVHEEPRIHDSPTSAQADDTRDFPKPEIKEEGDEVPTSDSARLQAHAYDVPTAAVKAIHEQPLIHDFPTSAQADDTRDLPKPETSEEADQVPTSDSARLQADAYNVPVAPVKAIHEEALSYDTPTSAQADGRRDYSKPEIEKEVDEVLTNASARLQADAYDVPTAAAKAPHEQQLIPDSPISAHEHDTRYYSKPGIKEEGDDVPTSDSARLQADTYDIPTAAVKTIHEQQLIPDSPISAQADNTRDFPKPEITEEGDDVPTSDSARLQAHAYDVPTAAVKAVHEEPLSYDSPTSAQADDMRDFPKPEIKVEVDVVPTSDSARLQAHAYDVPTAAAKAIHEQQLIPDSPMSAQADDTRDFPKTETNEEADEVPTSDCAPLQADAYDVPTAAVKAVHEEPRIHDSPTSAQADDTRDFPKPEIKEEGDEVLTNASARLQADAYDVPTAAAKAPHEQQLIPDSPMSAQADDTRDFPKAETNEEADEVPTSDCAPLQADAYDVPTAAVKAVHEEPRIHDSPTSAQADDTRDFPKPEIKEEGDEVPTSDSARLQAHAYDVPTAAVKAIHEEPLSYDSPTSAQADDTRDLPKPETSEEADQVPTSDSARLQADAYNVPVAPVKAIHEEALSYDSPTSAQADDMRDFPKPEIKVEVDVVPTSDSARLQAHAYDVPTAAAKAPHEQQLIPDSPISAQADDTGDFPKTETNEEADEVPTSDCAPLQADAYDVPTAAVKAVHEEPRIHDSPTSAQADDTRDFPKPEIKEEEDEVPTSDSARLQAHAYDVPTAAVKAIHEQPLIHDFPTSAQADDTRDLPKPETSEEADQVPTSDSARLQADAYNVPVAPVKAIHEEALSYDTPTSAQADGRRDYSKPEIEKEVDEVLTNASARLQADAYDLPTAAVKAIQEEALSYDTPTLAQADDTGDFPKTETNEEADEVPTSDSARLQAHAYDILTAAVKTIHEQQLIPDSPTSAQADDTRDFPKPEIKEEGDEVPTSDSARLQADAYDVPTAAVKAIHEQPLIHDFPTSAQADDTRDLPKPETSEEADQVPTSDSARLQADAYNVPAAAVKAIHEEPLSYDSPTSAQADDTRDFPKPEIKVEGDEVPTSVSARLQADAYDVPTAAAKAIHEQQLIPDSPTSAQADDTRDFPEPEIKEEGDEVPTSDSALLQADTYDIPTAAVKTIHEQQLIPDSPTSAQADDTRDFPKPEIEKEGVEVPTSDSARLQADAYDVPTAAVKAIHEEPLSYDSPTSAQADDTRDYSNPEIKEEKEEVPTSDSARLQVDAYDVPTAAVKALEPQQLIHDSASSAHAAYRRDIPKPEIKGGDKVPTSDSARLHGDAYDVPRPAVKAIKQQPIIHDSASSAHAAYKRDIQMPTLKEKGGEGPTSDSARIQAVAYDVPRPAVKALEHLSLDLDSARSGADPYGAYDVPRPATKAKENQASLPGSARLQAGAYDVPRPAVKAVEQQPIIHDSASLTHAAYKRDIPKPEIKGGDEVPTTDSARPQADAYDVPRPAVKAVEQQPIIHDSASSAHAAYKRDIPKPAIKGGDEVPTSDSARLQAGAYDVPRPAVKAIKQQPIIHDSASSAHAAYKRHIQMPTLKEKRGEVPTSDSARLQAGAYDVPRPAVKAIKQQPLIHDSASSAQAAYKRDIQMPTLKERGGEGPTSDSARLQAGAYDVPRPTVKAIKQQPIIHDSASSAHAAYKRDIQMPTLKEKGGEGPTSDSARLQAVAYDVPRPAVKAIKQQPIIHDSASSAHAAYKRDIQMPTLKEKGGEGPTSDSARIQAVAYDVPRPAVKALEHLSLDLDSARSGADPYGAYDVPRPATKAKENQASLPGSARLQAGAYDVPRPAVKAVEQQPLIHDSASSAQAAYKRDIQMPTLKEKGGEGPTSDSARLQAVAYDVPRPAVKAIKQQPIIHDSASSAHAAYKRDIQMPTLKEKGGEGPTSDSARLQAGAYDVPRPAVKAVEQQPLIHDSASSAQAAYKRDIQMPTLKEKGGEGPTSDSARLRAGAYDVPRPAVKAIKQQPIIHDSASSAHAAYKRDIQMPTLKEKGGEGPTSDSARLQAGAYDVPRPAVKAVEQQPIIHDSASSTHAAYKRDIPKPAIKGGDEVPTTDSARHQPDAYDVPRPAVKAVEQQPLILDSASSAPAAYRRDIPKPAINGGDGVPTSDRGPPRAELGAGISSCTAHARSKADKASKAIGEQLDPHVSVAGKAEVFVVPRLASSLTGEQELARLGISRLALPATEQVDHMLVSASGVTAHNPFTLRTSGTSGENGSISDTLCPAAGQSAKEMSDNRSKIQQPLYVRPAHNKLSCPESEEEIFGEIGRKPAHASYASSASPDLQEEIFGEIQRKPGHENSASSASRDLQEKIFGEIHVEPAHESAAEVQKWMQGDKTREREWQKAEGAGGLSDEPSHFLYEPDTKRWRTRRPTGSSEQQPAPATRREEKGVNELVSLRSLIRSCVLEGPIDPLHFCTQTGFISECTRTLNTFARTNSFKTKDLYIIPVDVVSDDEDTLLTVVPLLPAPLLAFLAQLDYSLSQRCRYSVGTLTLVQLLFRDAVDSFLGSTQQRTLIHTPDDTLVRAVSFLNEDRAFSPADSLRLLETTLKLNATLVKAGSARYIYPRFIQLLNFTCRSRRVCLAILGEVVRKFLGPFSNSAKGRSTNSTLVYVLRGKLANFFNGHLGRLATHGAVVLSRWFTQSINAIIESTSTGNNEEREISTQTILPGPSKRVGPVSLLLARKAGCYRVY